MLYVFAVQMIQQVFVDELVSVIVIAKIEGNGESEYANLKVFLYNSRSIGDSPMSRRSLGRFAKVGKCSARQCGCAVDAPNE